MDDRGSATPVAAVLSLVVLLLLWWLVQLGAATAARHRAEGAADLAALAAAAHAIGGPESACAQAERVTRGMRTRLITCTLTGREARVEVAGELPGPLAGKAPPSARARAGPATR
ncbi:flp pilus-assembly TadE/G-like family protein [Saccharopolyspora sp. TS4A08]|uniref:Flp pilus-assembly TadE/G-like family protein n=1 Tax=Saccharopolyspora ipomoeae TaxID=3042027 RepID=A0ABT6PXW8_9PSEU|nr:Rv3654c family TadE-like protein [Saccharopolyspora sp. TS4A08]MDI2032811.1 flp pilus-assembly TadE/G-like family protein [Saccharopolyspora sp. TS4A08]